MSAGSNMQDLEAFIRNMPAGIRAETASLNPNQLTLVLMLVYFFAPLYLILPMMTASVIAADSFAGEKERKTLEALLYTPTTDRELFLAKCLGAFLPALAVGIGSFLIYSVVVNLAGWPIMGRIFFPNVTWLLLAFFVGPAAAGLGLVAMVFVSSRVSSFQDAYQLGSLVVLPVVMLMLGQTFGVVFLSVEFAVMLGVVLSLIDLALLYLGARVFSRSEIISRL